MNFVGGVGPVKPTELCASMTCVEEVMMRRKETNKVLEQFIALKKK